MATNPDGDGFLSRWARRKAQVRSGGDAGGDPTLPVADAAAAPVAALTRAAAAAPAALEPRASTEGANAQSPAPAALPEPPAPPQPTLAEVALLTRESDYSRFVGAGVDTRVNQAAMKKLFTDPHFNVMDGLDTYIDDYGKPDPIPLAMLRQMNQSKFLRLFDDDEKEDEAQKAPDDLALPPALEAAPTQLPDPDPTTIASDDHPDLRLQQDDAARRPGPDQGPRA